MKTSLYQHPFDSNNSNDNHYFTNYSTNNRFVSNNDHQNSRINCLINNSIKDKGMPNS